MCKFFFFFPELARLRSSFFFSFFFRVCQTPDFSNSLFRVIILTTPWLRAAIPYAVELLAAATYQAQAQEGTEAAVAVSEIQVEEQQVEGQAQAQEGA